MTASWQLFCPKLLSSPNPISVESPPLRKGRGLKCFHFRKSHSWTSIGAAPTWKTTPIRRVAVREIELYRQSCVPIQGHPLKPPWISEHYRIKGLLIGPLYVLFCTFGCIFFCVDWPIECAPFDRPTFAILCEFYLLIAAVDLPGH